MRTPSGPQWAGSELEAELLEQLNVALGIFDVVTIGTPGRSVRGPASSAGLLMAVQLHCEGGGPPSRYVIRTAAHDDALPERPGRAVESIADLLAARFGVLTERDVRTPGLCNARLLTPHLGRDPSDLALDVIWAALGKGPMRLDRMTALLALAGIEEAEAASEVGRAIANGYVHWDRGAKLNGSATLRARTFEDVRDNDDDPLLQAIRMLRPSPE